ncbi:MAG: diguanylate cyclase [Nitrospiria bacterium]
MMSKTLLIVDDSALIRKSIIKILEPMQMFARILQAKNGLEALEILLKEEIDLLISDLVMPRMDGLKLLATLRNLERYRDLPVILLSSQDEADDKIKGLQGGANDYITKPFESAELVARIKNLLMMKELQDELAKKNKALELTNKKLEQLSVTDELTGLWNRRYLWERLAEEIAKTRRYNLTLSCLMSDIDNFKTINDRYGHITGDTVLSEIARLLKNQCRSHDLLARFGGEEFIMVLYQTGMEGAVQLAHRLVKTVDSHPFIAENQKTLKTTISIGVATYSPQTMTNGNDLIKKADESLYQAKRKGKNRVGF